METVINNPNRGDEGGGGMGLIVGLIVGIIVVILLIFLVGPRLQNGNEGAEQLDVQVELKNPIEGGR
ncbi:MAG: hypothetical protein A3G52_04865 [Candidatus Taylorbacteria bacterium RIFCSPLOWO2_12_FULL_43_20]|uniref:Uncharacterized protein n=1 Tax=Candidatus Taylorbacteria bacterium RIFCSPLOWO2_12_FULL_43_20 TaxID=1802332 RepID=A0A1G2P427_9BACT|nr:MAG: hypothetical protein A3B98_04470 [Candidatus Taylorbacteria bacterium RIFCSPHIGHO2_02_FULL_43_55]OHA29853.1 MAG: hypothetical protein A3E92_02595 [Candidatus Taylorbacteria bacterium RIFCSPHIGHO2_12_FULL_42_34]OHA31641.1 MAG: hypothetical protein A3B09_03560 [Candidatus Taylorbacteria bacterium RIFCSPLOWO2_01_FULL_43_83]OHA38943.1 MAG: hypothetical protein A3H58_01295 [Candidatus Taylorbacteria bacterium RIFCSPLOWO2_02_FULL_43_22b]OHA42382.1 MAG: hypothetical protein A3G52_04865 [Candid